MADPSDARHDNADVADILRRAIELQSEAGPHEQGLARTDGFTTEELKQIAREAGVEPRFVDAALADRRIRLSAPQPASFFGSTRCCLHGSVDGELSRERQAAIIGSLRSTSALQGRITETSLGIEWRADEFTQLAVSISPKENATAIELVANRGAAMALLTFLTFLPTLILVVAIAEGFSLGMGAGLVLLALGLGTWMTTVITISRRNSRRWQAHLSQVLREALAAAQTASPPVLAMKEASSEGPTPALSEPPERDETAA